MARQVTELDTHAVRELRLFVDNDGRLYEQQTVPTIKAQMRKWRAGRFNPVLSVRAWRYLADAGAKKYQREFGVLFGTDVREAVARQLSEEFAEAAAAGEYDDLVPAKGYEAELARGTQLGEVDPRSRLVGPFRAVRARFDVPGAPQWFWFAIDPLREISSPWYAHARTLPALAEKLRAQYAEQMRGARPPWKVDRW